MKKIVLLFFILLYSCNANKTYINKAIDIMEENSIKKDSVDWKRMRTGSLIQIKKNNSRGNVYQIIRKNLFLIKDNHSMFLTKESLGKIYKPEFDVRF